MVSGRPSPARVAPCGRRTRALEFRAQTFPDTIRNAVPPVGTTSRSPLPRGQQRRRRCRNAEDQRTEFPPMPTPGWDNLLPRSDANLGTGFVSDVLSFANTPNFIG